MRLAKVFKKLILTFYHCFRTATDFFWAVKMISNPLSIEIYMHVIDNGNNEIRGGGVERDAGGDEKQLIKFTWPYCNVAVSCQDATSSGRAASVM